MQLHGCSLVVLLHSLFNYSLNFGRNFRRSARHWSSVPLLIVICTYTPLLLRGLRSLAFFCDCKSYIALSVIFAVYTRNKINHDCEENSRPDEWFNFASCMYLHVCIPVLHRNYEIFTLLVGFCRKNATLYSVITP